MKKSEWISRAAKNSGMTKKQVEQAYDALEDVLVEALQSGEAVQISGFGSFEVRTKEARTGRNPQTNEIIEIPASRRLVFLCGKKMKETINET